MLQGRFLQVYTLITFFTCFRASAQTGGPDKSKPQPLQEGRLTGEVFDGKNKPVAYATITLLHTDSTVVNGDLTKEDGSFNIAPTGLGSFLLRINAIGFDTRFVGGIELTGKANVKNLGRLKVQINSKLLSEVEVTGERPVMEMSVDKKVFNVEKNITSTGGSAADVLKNVPSLDVDVDGGILLRGKETTILIDGKPATLLGGDIASALQSLPASSIASVEVITNPSARFDAQGMAGIINIITKKNGKFGLNGSVTAGMGTGNKYNGSVNLNLRNDKWNVFFNSNLRLNRNYQRTANNTRDMNGVPISGSYEDNIRKFNGWFNTIGAEYTIDSMNSISLTENLNLMQWGGDDATISRGFINGMPDSFQRRTSDHMGSPLSSSTSLDYKHKFRKPKQELTANITYAKTWVDREQTYTTYNFDKDGNQDGSTVIQNAPGSGSTASLNGQADFTTPFLSRTGKLDAGWKTQLTWFESANNPSINLGSGDYVDSSLLNNYNYSQQVHAGYASFSDHRGKWSYQAGLRLEYSAYSGKGQNNTNYTNEFLGLFPSAYLSYKLNKQQDIYLSYTRRTDRPGFFQLMPYTDVSNPQEISKGNPDLVPEFIHNTELSYSRQFEKGHQLIFSGYYQYTQNLIERIRTSDDGGLTYFTQPQNLAHGSTYGAELTGRAQILPIWDLTLNLNFFQNRITTGIDSLPDNNGSSFFGKLNTNLKLPYGFSLQVSGSYEAPKVSAQGRTQEVYLMDAALRKSLWNNKASVVLNISDIFNTRKYTTVYDFTDYTQTIYRDRETRVGNITFTYRFGRSDAKTNRRKSQSGQAPVKDRNNLKQGDDSDQGGY